MELFGYRPSIGELLIAFILAIIAERSARVFSRTLDQFFDRVAENYKKFRVVRVARLEKQLTQLKMYENDGALVLRDLLFYIGRSVTLIIYFCAVWVMKWINDIKFSADACTVSVPNIETSHLLYEYLESTAKIGIISLLFVVTAMSLFISFKTVDLIDQAGHLRDKIERLERRISVLKSS